LLSLHLAAAISLAGLVLSLYLTVAPVPEFCEITSFVSCDRVLSSPYAKFLGIPTAMYGAVWFATASSTAFLAVDRKPALKLLVAWSAAGVAGVAVLVYVELFLINAVCLLCTAAHVLILAVLGLSVYELRRQQQTLTTKQTTQAY